MKISSLTQSLLIALVTLAGQSIAWSQCLVYNATYKGSSSGQTSSSYSGKGYTIIGPSQTMQDGVTRCATVSFQLYTGKGYKDFYYNDTRTPVDGVPSSGGLLTGLVKQGKNFRILATIKDIFDSDTISGTASIRNVPGIGSTYIATTLAGTYSGWGQDANESRPIGDSTSTANNPVKAYKFSASDSYTYNSTLTAAVAGKTFDQAVVWAKQTLISQGYTDRVAIPYPSN
jgi:hypothetical protein